MPNNFEDLTEKQQNFLQKYLRTGGVFASTKEKNETFNDQFDAAVSPLYRKINDIEATIAEMDRTYPASHASLYASQLGNWRVELQKLIAGSQKLFKKRELPDFSFIQNGLAALEKSLAAHQKSITDGLEGFEPTATDKLRADKSDCADQRMEYLDNDEVQAQRLFLKARAQRLLPEDVREREAAIAAYEEQLSQARDGVSSLFTEQVDDETIELSAFEASTFAIIDAFTQASSTQIELLNALSTKAPPSSEELSARLARDHGDLDTVKLETARMENVTAELAKVNTALATQIQKRSDLSAEMEDASAADQIRMRGERKALNAHIAQIEMRAAQLAAFQEQQAERERILLVTAGEAAQASDRAEALLGDTETDWLDVRLAGLLEAPIFANNADYDSPTELFSLEEIRKKINDTRDTLAKAAKREVIIPRLDTDEPRMMEISAEELGILNKMLNVAMTFAADGRTDLAYALHEEVLDLRRKFTSARNMLKLPPPIPPAPSPGKLIIRQLTNMIADLGDIWGAGNDAAEPLMNQGQDLLAQAEAAEANDAFKDNPTLFATDIKSLVTAMKALGDPPPEAATMTTAKAKAKEEAAFLDGWLDKLVKSEKLPDNHIIEEPGKTYSRAEKRLLVRPDEILTVRNAEGELEQHRMLMTRKGKGGEDHAKYDNWVAEKVPMDVLQSLHTRGETLRMMAESGAPGSEAAMEAYAQESHALFQDIQKNGPTFYPEIKALIKRCDKILASGTVAEFLPDSTGKVKNAYEAFKSGYLDKTPTKAKEEADAREAEIIALEAEAEEVKIDYGKAKTKYGKIVKDLKGNKNKSDEAVAVGKLMQKVLNSDPAELFNSSSVDADDDTRKALVEARERFEKVKTFYDKNPHDMSDKQMSGPWLSTAETAMKKLDSKVHSNIKDADSDLDGIAAAMRDFYARMDGMDTATGAELAAKLIEMCEKLHLSAKTASDTRKARREFGKKNDEMKTAIAEQKKIAGKRGKNPIAEQLKAEAQALESKRSSVQSTVEGTEDYAAGMADFEEMERKLDAITQALGETESGGSKRNIKKMKIGDKIPALVTFVDRMKDTAAGLADAEMRKRMSAEQEDDYEPKIAIVETSLRRISALPDLGPLDTLARKIDDANAAEGPTKADRVKWRESALAEIRKLRTALELDPAVQIYAKNPFDLGTELRLVRTALQQVEVAVLVSVDPKEKE